MLLSTNIINGASCLDSTSLRKGLIAYSQTCAILFSHQSSFTSKSTIEKQKFLFSVKLSFSAHRLLHHYRRQGSCILSCTEIWKLGHVACPEPHLPVLGMVVRLLLCVSGSGPTAPPAPVAGGGGVLRDRVQWGCWGRPGRAKLPTVHQCSVAGWPSSGHSLLTNIPTTV